MTSQSNKLGQKYMLNDTNFKICLGLFGCEVNILPKQHIVQCALETNVTYLDSRTVWPMIRPGLCLASLRAVEDCQAATLPACWSVAFSTFSFSHLSVNAYFHIKSFEL